MKEFCLKVLMLACATSMINGEYVIGVASSNTCSAGSIKITTEADCDAAAAALGKIDWGAMESPSYPGGCLEQLSNTRVQWNTHPIGAAMAGYRPVCESLPAIVTTTNLTTTTNVTTTTTTTVPSAAGDGGSGRVNGSSGVNSSSGGSNKAKTVSGSFTLEVSDAAAFTGAKVAEVKMALAAAIAGSLGESITKDMVTITSITLVEAATRRLDAMLNERRLAAGNVKVEYQIDLPATYTGSTITKESFEPATLKAQINTELKKITAFEATVIGTPIIAAVTVVDAITATTAAASALISGTHNLRPGCFSLVVVLCSIFVLFLDQGTQIGL